jgi:hypothetical protein
LVFSSEVGFNRDNAAGAEQQANDDGSVSEYFIGPYCNLKDNFTVNLGLFADPYCSKSVDAELYMSELFYEADLPYTTVSIVDADTCIDCSNVDENQNSNNNNNNAPEVSETCEAMYSYAAKCERNMTIDEPDTSACDFIYGVVPPPNTVSPPPPPPPTNVSCQTDTQDSNTANQSLFEKCNPRAFSVVFGMAVTFGITTLVLLGAHAYLMYTATDNVPPPPSASQKNIPSSRSVEMEA